MFDLNTRVLVEEVSPKGKLRRRYVGTIKARRKIFAGSPEYLIVTDQSPTGTWVHERFLESALTGLVGAAIDILQNKGLIP